MVCVHLSVMKPQACFCFGEFPCSLPWREADLWLEPGRFGAIEFLCSPNGSQQNDFGGVMYGLQRTPVVWQHLSLKESHDVDRAEIILILFYLKKWWFRETRMRVMNQKGPDGFLNSDRPSREIRSSGPLGTREEWAPSYCRIYQRSVGSNGLCVCMYFFLISIEV